MFEDANVSTLETIRNRRSIRVFEDKPIVEPVLKAILEDAIWAPSSMNMQPYRWYIAQTPSMRKRLAECLNNPSAATTAPVLCVNLACWGDWPEASQEFLTWAAQHPGLSEAQKQAYARKMSMLPQAFQIPREELRIWAVKSAALSCENLMLSASARGISSCPMEGGPEALLRAEELLGGVNFETASITMVIALGYKSPKHMDMPTWRRAFSKLVHFI
ncbi:MAG: nitroreductase family protein [Proteobacteria bacterium]|nr:nitroreductase family protein [Cystobacterineae bacterium]MCL2258487.1 nitroreductase family protein [Cystobacterineae bacterium]MCL2315173.1 nitroreductase family protein [Pseudomonadota bacterium]